MTDKSVIIQQLRSDILGFMQREGQHINEIERLRQFAEFVIRESCWRGCDLDGGSVQDKAEALGLLRKESYSQERHGEAEGCFEPGDDIFVFAWKP